LFFRRPELSLDPMESPPVEPGRDFHDGIRLCSQITTLQKIIKHDRDRAVRICFGAQIGLSLNKWTRRILRKR
jgi:hypothetical protein